MTGEQLIALLSELYRPMFMGFPSIREQVEMPRDDLGIWKNRLLMFVTAVELLENG